MSVYKMFTTNLMAVLAGLVLAQGALGADAALKKALVDQTGRTVTVPVSARRVVSLAPSITEIIFGIGRGDLLKGVTTYSDYPEAAKHLPKIGSYVYLDLEKIVSLKPDLCIGIKDGNPRELVFRLESFGIPVYAVDPRDLGSVMETIVEIGDILEAPAEARRVAEEMQARLDRVRRQVATVGKRPRIFFQIGIAPIVSVGSDTFIHELIGEAGGINLAEDYKGYPRFSVEDIVAAGPDVLIITSMARNQVFAQVREEWRKYPMVPAVKNDRIFLVDSNFFDRPSPRLMDGLETLVRLIHPEFDGERP